jgi:hypothetical protein
MGTAIRRRTPRQEHCYVGNHCKKTSPNVCDIGRRFELARRIISRNLGGQSRLRTLTAIALVDTQGHGVGTLFHDANLLERLLRRTDAAVQALPLTTTTSSGISQVNEQMQPVRAGGCLRPTPHVQLPKDMRDMDAGSLR